MGKHQGEIGLGLASYPKKLDAHTHTHICTIPYIFLLQTVMCNTIHGKQRVVTGMVSTYMIVLKFRPPP